MDPYLRRDPEYQSFVTVFRGFQYVGKQLEPYTRAGLRRVHQLAYRANAGMPQCVLQCSRLHGKSTYRWCQTCKAWKNTLTRSRTRPFSRWENTESWNWANDYETITPVFLPDFWNGDVRLDEFGTACHMWSTCQEYRLDKQLLKKLRDFRNKLFGHNPDLKVTEADKKKVFDALKALLRENDVQSFVNTGQCQQDLDKIAKGDELSEFMNDMKAGLDHNIKATDNVNVEQKILATCVNAWFGNVCREMYKQNKTLGTIKRTLDNEDNEKRIFKGIIGAFCALILLSAILGGCFWSQSHYISPVLYSQYSECLSEMYSYPFPQDLPLLPYLREHSQLIGRKWLLDEIKTYVGDTNSTEKGLIITADIGYGKSALVKHLLCASTDDKAYKIRSQIVAFHVCRFDVPTTRDPQRFIYRLVGFLSTRFPEFGGILSALPEAALLNDENKCRKDIIACFNQGILFPLLGMKTAGSEPQIIIVDALDECHDQGLNDNEIGQLLKARYENIPKWIKFIVTSRPTFLLDNINSIKRFYLDQSDHRNLADIKQYIEYKLNPYPQLYPVQKKLDTLLDKSEGNFLFIIHFLEYLISNNSTEINKFPSTLNGVYEMNFARSFHSVDEFNAAKEILELIVASLHPLSQGELESILENTNVSQISHTKRVLKKLAFCFRASKEITLVHQSLNAWLISEDNKSFRILASRGHAIFSRYLLNQINDGPFDIVNIAIHIGNSNDRILKKAFSSIFSSKNVTNATLHTLVWKSKSVAALDLILNLQVGADTLNEGNVTSAFIAAARGHLGQLKLLKSKGANLNFKVNDAYLIMSPIQLDEIRQNYFFGYGLIHIASQFGHLEIVEYLLNYNISMRHHTNGFGLSVTDIVCENGHLDLLENILLKYTFDAQRCLYYAAKGGHADIIRTLASHGKNASCISRLDAVNALAILKNIDTSKTIIAFNTSEYHDINAFNTYEYHDINLFNTNDLWWIVYRESPLHAAIMAKNEDVALMVVKHYPHLADCVNSFGMTPLLVSVKENKTQVFENLVERTQKEICQHAFDDVIIKTNSERYVCLAGSTYAHLDGIYGRIDMTLMLWRKGIHIDWFVKDSNSLTAVHYAACMGNMLFLQMIYETGLTSFSNIRSNNQSTPYHSAAICGSTDAFSVIIYFENVIPNVVDSNKMSILHYLVLKEYHERIADTISVEEQSKSLSILKRIIEDNISIASSDSHGRNFLHYALKNGHYHIIGYLNQTLNDIYKFLLQQQDEDGHTPVEFAIRNCIGKLYSHYIEIPVDSNYYDIFSCKCTNVSSSKHLSTWEAGLVVVLHTDKTGVFHQFKKLLKHIILKSVYVTTAFLTISNTTEDMIYLRRHITEIIQQYPTPLTLGVLARHRPKLFSICGELLAKSPLHLIAYTYNADVLMSNTRFLNLVFGDPVNTGRLSCADTRGYNSFHYALMGGNILMAIRLFDIGVSITNKKVSVIDVTWMMLLGKKRQIVISSKPCSDQLSCIDYLLHRIFKIHLGDAIVLSDICLKHSVGLSVVHVVAASGLTESMNILKMKYGREIIACRNQDGITPFYLWDIMNDIRARDTFNLTLEKHPRPETETLLILGLLCDFPTLFFNKGTVRQLYDINRYSTRKMVTCTTCFLGIEFDMDSFDDSSFPIQKLNIYLINAIRALGRFSTSFEINKDTIKTAFHDIKRYALTFQTICRTKALQLSFNYPNLKKLIDLKIHEMGCDIKRSDVANLFCIQTYHEFKHVLNRIIAKERHSFIEYYILMMKQTHDWFIDYNIRTTQTYGMMYMYTRAQIRRPSRLFVKKGHNSIGISEKQIIHIFRHNYLNVLKKTVKYQYAMKKISMSQFSYKTQATDDYKPNIVYSVPKPFQQIMKYINSSSYS